MLKRGGWSQLAAQAETTRPLTIVYAAEGSGIRAELAKQESLNGFMQQGHHQTAFFAVYGRVRRLIMKLQPFLNFY
jgi:hypothetical protein